LEYYGKALALDEELGNKAGVATNGLATSGLCIGISRTIPLPWSTWQKALALAEELGNKAGVANSRQYRDCAFASLGLFPCFGVLGEGISA
jgi:hypothetical protein